MGTALFKRRQGQVPQASAHVLCVLIISLLLIPRNVREFFFNLALASINMFQEHLKSV